MKTIVNMITKIHFSKGTVPLLIGLTAVIIFYIPGMGELLQFDRNLIANGELWRIFTGHLTHCSTSHLFWDVIVFIVLGFICCYHRTKYFILFIAGSSLAVATTVWLFEPELLFYRGLSGIDSALFCWVVLMLLKKSLNEHNQLFTCFATIMLCTIVGKTVYECLYTATIFADSANFIPIPSAHLAGIGFSLFIAIWQWIFAETAEISPTMLIFSRKQ